ncbi:MAG: hypothetical protein R8G66_30790 [Cytophagales bacterium]|nr:hypothetical protein [Cytophagales bacterium]
MIPSHPIQKILHFQAAYDHIKIGVRSEVEFQPAIEVFGGFFYRFDMHDDIARWSVKAADRERVFSLASDLVENSLRVESAF